MPTLNDLTIPYIKKLAEELQIDLKPGIKEELIEQIKNSEVSSSYLEVLIVKYLKEKNKAKIKKKRKLLDIPELEERIEQLEEKVENLISSIESNISDSHKILKIGEKEKIVPKVKKKPSVKTEIKDLADIQNFIKSILKPGDSISIDELIRIDELQNISLNLLNQAINSLINEGSLKATEGRSIQKIQGNIGKLIRMK